ncbi:MAG: acyl carrier protein [Mogibacterium sp.]|nr:acyl carrier protein [Mogibacterium sp.]
MEELREILEELRPDLDFDEEKALIDDGLLDSFDIMSLVGSIDEEFDIKIKPADLVPENFNSIEAIWELVQRLEDE